MRYLLVALEWIAAAGLTMDIASARKEAIKTLLKGIETGDPASVVVVNEAKYIQHNPHTHAGSEGLAVLFARIAQSSPKVEVVRVFADGDFVFGHTEYDFSTRKIGFEVFRFEGDQAVEHWDNIQPRRGPNASGRSMVDGPVKVTDLDRTEANRDLVARMLADVFIRKDLDDLTRYVDGHVLQHDPNLVDGIDAFRSYLESDDVVYDKVHRVLAEGNFVLAACEGSLAGVHNSFYHLFRLSTDGIILEHWNTIEPIPPRSEWKNDNGKF